MKLTFIGAAHEVTGSCHYLEACGKHILIDCGLEQGPDLYENQEIPINPSMIDYILLTHAHIDHSGKIPLLVKNGFKGEIICTFATSDLCSIMLRDSAHIQESEAEWRNRKALRSGAPLYEPLYTVQDAMNAVALLAPIDYNQTIQLCEDQPIIKDPQHVDAADYLVIESTYGNRVHSTVKPDYIKDLTRVLRETFAKGGNVVIPSFAVGRTQELLYFIREIKENNLLPEYQNFEVYVDSPLAIEATNVFQKNVQSCFDEDAMALISKGINPLLFQGLKTTITSEESKMINFNDKPKVIISASGMCEAGRIRHHLKHNLWRKECTILFVGYQAVGTLGRKLVESKPESVRLFGENVEVNARIEVLAGISGHADMNGLLNWIDGFKEKPSHIFVVHGEDSVTDSFAATITDRFGIPAFAPYSGGCVDLATDTILSEGIRLPKKAVEKPVKARALTAFNRVVAAAKHLMDVVLKNEGLANKDLAKFESQIQNLADKWDRDDR